MKVAVLGAAAASVFFMSSLLSAPRVSVAQPAAGSITPDDYRLAGEMIRRRTTSRIAYELVESLTTEIGPRPAGSRADLGAVAWAEARMRSVGLENVRRQDVVVPRWERGDAELRMLVPYSQSLAGVALGGSVGTDSWGIEESVVQVPDLDALKKMRRSDAAGRIIFLNTRMQRTRDSSGYLQAVPNRMAGASVAAGLGAKALVIRSIGTSADRIAHTGLVQYDAAFPRIPAFALANPDADLLERVLQKADVVRLSLRSSSRDLDSAISSNVLGEISGSATPEEIVLLAAHLDSWDLGQGAIDDGAGVAIVLAAAALMREARGKPRRTIRVVLFANEEYGLSGANAYAREAAGTRTRHAVAIEADSGGDSVWRFNHGGLPKTHPGIGAIAGLLSTLEIDASTDIAEGSSDLKPLRESGVPVVGLTQDRSRYFDAHHSANDTLDRIEPQEIAQAAAVYAATTWMLAQYTGSWASQQ